MVEEDNGAAHALDAGRSKVTRVRSEGFSKIKAMNFAVKSGGVADRTGFDCPGELVSSRCARGSFRSGEEIMDKEMGERELCGHFSFHLAVRERRAGIRGVGGIRGRAAVEWLQRTSSRSLRNSWTCARVMRKGGKKRSAKNRGCNG